MKNRSIFRRTAGLGLAAVMVAALGLLTACAETPGTVSAPPASVAGQDASAGAQPESGLVMIEDPPLPGIDVVLPEMELIVNEDAGGSVIQVPQYVADPMNPELDKLNAEMVAFAGDYGDYVGGAPQRL